MGIPDHLTCLLRNLYSDQEATARTMHETSDWFPIRKGVCQGWILSHCLFNLYEEYVMWNAGLDEAQAGINIAGRGINNLRYADDTTLMVESEEELKSLLMKVKEKTGKSWLKTLLLPRHFSRVWTLVTPWTAAYQPPPSMGFPKQEYWSRVPVPSPGLKLNIQKTKIMASLHGPITSWQIDGETMQTVTDSLLWGLQNHCRWWLQSWN